MKGWQPYFANLGNSELKMLPQTVIFFHATLESIRFKGKLKGLGKCQKPILTWTAQINLQSQGKGTL